MRTIIDRQRVKMHMAQRGVDTFTELIEKSGLAQTTFYESLGEPNWKSKTLDALAEALECEPWDLVVRRRIEEE